MSPLDGDLARAPVKCAARVPIGDMHDCCTRFIELISCPRAYCGSGPRARRRLQGPERSVFPDEGYRWRLQAFRSLRRGAELRRRSGETDLAQDHGKLDVRRERGRIAHRDLARLRDEPDANDADRKCLGAHFAFIARGSGLSRFCRGKGRRDHMRIAAAPADVAADRPLNVLGSGIGASFQKRRGTHGHARRAESALHRVMRDESLLDRVLPLR